MAIESKTTTFSKLESLLSDAFKGKGFQKISEMIQEKDKYVPQKCKKQLLNQLDKALKKVDAHLIFFSCMCLPFYMVTWFERTREFLSLIEVKESNYLVNLVEDLCDTTLIIGKSSTEGKKQLLGSFIQHLGHLATESNVNCALRQEESTFDQFGIAELCFVSFSLFLSITETKALRTLNTLLANVTREEKKAFAASEEMCLLMKELVKTIQEVGDYDIQVALVEALFRLMLKKQRDDLVHSWFEDQYVTKAFKEIKDRDFETDSRKFLNELNERLGDKRRIYSIPCKAAYADLIELKKPADNKLEEFWIDFNYGSESITFYLESLESTFWESVRLPKRDLSSYYLQEEQEEKILKIIMRRSVVINKAEITKIRIHFDSCFDILAPLLKAIGKEKMIILNEDENANLGDYQEQTATVSIQLERKEDLTETNSLSDVLTSRQSNESVTPETVTSSNRLSVSPSRSANTLAAPPSSQKLKVSRLQPKDKADEPDVEGEADIHVGETHPLEDDTLQKKKRARGS
ncbi:hypothetical protein Chor_003077, partial [Crotalus horridus]